MKTIFFYQNVGFVLKDRREKKEFLSCDFRIYNEQNVY